VPSIDKSSGRELPEADLPLLGYDSGKQTLGERGPSCVYRSPALSESAAQLTFNLDRLIGLRRGIRQNKG
jgi:hypothetical protein